MTDYYKKYLKYKQQYLQTKTNSLTGGMSPNSTTPAPQFIGTNFEQIMKYLGGLLNLDSFLIDSIHDDLLIPGTTDFSFVYDENKIIRNTVNNNAHLLGLIISNADKNINDYIKNETFSTDNDDLKKNITRMQEILKNSVVFIDAGAGGFKSLYNDDKQPWKPRDERNWICGDNKKDKYNIPTNNLNTNTFSNIFDSASIGKGCPVCIKTLANILNKTEPEVINEFYELVLTFLEGHSTGDYTLQDWIPAIQFLKQIEFTIGSDCKIIAAFNNTSSPFIISQAMCAEKINQLGEATIPRKEPKDSNKRTFIDNLEKFLKKQGKSDKIQIMVYRILKYMGDKSHFVWAVYLVLIDSYLKQSGWKATIMMGGGEDEPNFDIYEKGADEIQWPKAKSAIILMTIDRLLFSDIVKIMTSLQNESGIYRKIYNRLCIFITRTSGAIPISCDNLPLYTYASKNIPNLKCITVYKGESATQNFILFLYSIYSELKSAYKSSTYSINHDKRISDDLVTLQDLINEVDTGQQYTQEQVNRAQTYRYVYYASKVINQKNYSDNKFNEIILFHAEIITNFDILYNKRRTLDHYSKNLIQYKVQSSIIPGGRPPWRIQDYLKNSPILLGLYDPKDIEICPDGHQNCVPHNYDLEIYTKTLDNLTYIYNCLTKFDLTPDILDHLKNNTLLFHFCFKYINFFDDINHQGASAGVKIVEYMMTPPWSSRQQEGLNVWEVKGLDLPSTLLQQDIYYALKSICDICKKIMKIHKGDKTKLATITIGGKENILNEEFLRKIYLDEINESLKFFDSKIEFYKTQIPPTQGGSTINKKVSNKIIKNLYGGELGEEAAPEDILTKEGEEATPHHILTVLDNEHTQPTESYTLMPEPTQSYTLLPSELRDVWESIMSGCFKIINAFELNKYNYNMNLNESINIVSRWEGDCVSNPGQGICADIYNTLTEAANVLNDKLNTQIKNANTFGNVNNGVKVILQTIRPEFNFNKIDEKMNKLININLSSLIIQKTILISEVINLDNIIEIYSIKAINNQEVKYKLVSDIYICIYMFYFVYIYMNSLDPYSTAEEKVSEFVNEKSVKLEEFISTLPEEIQKNEFSLKWNPRDHMNYLLFCVFSDLADSIFKKLIDLAHTFDRIYMDEFFGDDDDDSTPPGDSTDISEIAKLWREASKTSSADDTRASITPSADDAWASTTPPASNATAHIPTPFPKKLAHQPYDDTITGLPKYPYSESPGRYGPAAKATVTTSQGANATVTTPQQPQPKEQENFMNLINEIKRFLKDSPNDENYLTQSIKNSVGYSIIKNMSDLLPNYQKLLKSHNLFDAILMLNTSSENLQTLYKVCEDAFKSYKTWKNTRAVIKKLENILSFNVKIQHLTREKMQEIVNTLELEIKNNAIHWLEVYLRTKVSNKNDYITAIQLIGEETVRNMLLRKVNETINNIVDSVQKYLNSESKKYFINHHKASVKQDPMYVAFHYQKKKEDNREENYGNIVRYSNLNLDSMINNLF